jgi:multiple antibiotic resistance protein
MVVFLWTNNHIYTIEEQAITTLLLLIVVGITLCILLAAKFVQKAVGTCGIIAISKVMGLISS